MCFFFLGFTSLFGPMGWSCAESHAGGCIAYGSFVSVHNKHGCSVARWASIALPLNITRPENNFLSSVSTWSLALTKNIQRLFLKCLWVFLGLTCLFEGWDCAEIQVDALFGCCACLIRVCSHRGAIANTTHISTPENFS